MSGLLLSLHHSKIRERCCRTNPRFPGNLFQGWLRRPLHPQDAALGGGTARTLLFERGSTLSLGSIHTVRTALSAYSDTTPREYCRLLFYHLVATRTTQQPGSFPCWNSRVQTLWATLRAPQSLY